jgi:hypothetical protein
MSTREDILREAGELPSEDEPDDESEIEAPDTDLDFDPEDSNSVQISDWDPDQRQANLDRIRDEVDSGSDPTPGETVRLDRSVSGLGCDRLSALRDAASGIDADTDALEERLVDGLEDNGCEVDGVKQTWTCHVEQDGDELASASVETRNGSAAKRAARVKSRARADTETGERYRQWCEQT